MMKHILGLDLGTNSIGWALVKSEQDCDDVERINGIEAAGSRIIPMDAAVLGDFAKGNTKSQTADRTAARGIRRMGERYKLRRERLNRVLDVMGFLPEHYSVALTRYGKFKDGEDVRCLTIGLYIICARRLCRSLLRNRNWPGCCSTSTRSAAIIS